MTCPTTHPMRTRDALVRLFVARPNEAITRSDVCEVLGRSVTAQAIHQAVDRLRPGLPVISDRRGYVYLLPIATGRPERCANCEHRSGRDCARTGSVVGLNEWCAGWGQG